MTAEGVVELCRELGQAGIEHLIFIPNVHELEPLETFGEKIIPAVADL
jgi:predicted deacetylase